MRRSLVDRRQPRQTAIGCRDGANSPNILGDCARQRGALPEEPYPEPVRNEKLDAVWNYEELR
jgi:hypothetical protein